MAHTLSDTLVRRAEPQVLPERRDAFLAYTARTRPGQAS